MPNKPNPVTPCMTVRDVAAYFSVSMPTVYAWCRAGEIAHIRMPGGGIRIRRADVELFEQRFARAAALTEPKPDTRARTRDAYELGKRYAQRRS